MQNAGKNLQVSQRQVRSSPTDYIIIIIPPPGAGAIFGDIPGAGAVGAIGAILGETPGAMGAIGAMAPFI
jgi:hypothetical protein